ncbi:polysaccharide lyase 8 family protein [Arthrobacter cupressi]|uniref:Hyaluronate lyase n=2 Tax=Arthrobacter cupressi TaxID=1045773 RepID=A0A1G8UKF7_9MICC|nr:polysaccharide lyase 8 family protein [Arthrobacter cupressi]SDJ54302.1 hyaluronate lyase [Arthrobacter cupressi]
MREKWRQILLGSDIAVSGQAQHALWEARDAGVSRLVELARAANDNRVFEDQPLIHESVISSGWTRLQSCAESWASPASRYFRSAELFEILSSSIERFDHLVFKNKNYPSGAWYTWEISIPRAFLNTVILLDMALPEAATRSCMAAIRRYSSSAVFQGGSTGRATSSDGANRVDLGLNDLLFSLITEDRRLLADSLELVQSVWTPVEHGAGFHVDGSFIQHQNVPYNGTYGVAALKVIATLMALVRDTSLALDAKTQSRVMSSVEESYIPFIVNGSMIDAVRGRAISRETETGIVDALDTIDAIIRISLLFPSTRTKRWQRLCKGWLEQLRDREHFTDRARKTSSLVRSKASELPDAIVKETLGHRLFPQMDRVVHREKGWALSLAMTSRRTPWFESGNGENFKGHHTSAGMRYLYRDTVPNNFEDGFWPTANLSGLPGTVVDRTPIPVDPQARNGASTPQNDWTGGSQIGPFAAVGHHLLAPHQIPMSARQSWFFPGGMLISMGSDIESRSGAEVVTTVEHRMVQEWRTDSLIVDGHRLPASNDVSSEAENARWAYSNETGGYLFLDGQPRRFRREMRKGNWRSINTEGSDESLQREFLTIEHPHGKSPTDASYAYALAPAASLSQTMALARKQPIKILRNDRIAQGISYGGFTGINFWAPGAAGAVSSEEPCSLCIVKKGGILQLAVSDPTQTAPVVQVHIAGKRQWQIKSTSRPGTAIQQTRNGIRLLIETKNLRGSSVLVELR